MVHLYPVLEALHHQRHGVVSIQSKSMGTGSSFEGVSSQKFARYLCLSMSGSHPWLSTSDTGLKLGEEPLRKAIPDTIYRENTDNLGYALGYAMDSLAPVWRHTLFQVGK